MSTSWKRTKIRKWREAVANAPQESAHALVTKGVLRCVVGRTSQRRARGGWGFMAIIHDPEETRAIVACLSGYALAIVLLNPEAIQNAFEAALSGVVVAL